MGNRTIDGWCAGLNLALRNLSDAAIELRALPTNHPDTAVLDSLARIKTDLATLLNKIDDREV